MPNQKHSAKDKRQAEHIEESEKKSGKSEEEAESIAWATVNKEKSEKRGGKGRQH